MYVTYESLMLCIAVGTLVYYIVTRDENEKK